MPPDVCLFGNCTYSQKGAASLSCVRELRCDVVYPARIESWRESFFIVNKNRSLLSINQLIRYFGFITCKIGFKTPNNNKNIYQDFQAFKKCQFWKFCERVNMGDWSKAADF